MLRVKVSRKHLVADDICSFELSPVDEQILPAFTAGAHIDVWTPAGTVRQYSLCNHPEERHRYLIGVLRDPHSRGGSQAMHELVQEGQELTISAPRNLFPLSPDGKKHILIAGGIGITPMLAMAYELSQRGVDFELHYCFRAKAKAAFIDVLESAPFARNVVLHDDSAGPDAALNASVLLQSPVADVHLYVCGPGGFMDYILKAAEAAHWPQEQVHREFFAAAPVDQTGDQAFEVVLARSALTFQIPADRSVFEVLDEAGIEIESSCEQGICGSCMTRVLEGTPDHRDQFMTKAEHALNDQFTPCCSRAKTPCLVLDL